MGIYIHEDIIADRVTQEEWSAVFNESLKLLDAFPFLDCWTRKSPHGHKYTFASRSQLRDNVFRDYKGWHSIGDMYTGANTEDFDLLADIDAYKSNGKDNGADILTYEIDEYTCPEIKIIDSNAVYSIFGNKTQGEKSHLYLLAIACMIADRLPDAVIVSGDINFGQCRAAVEWANQFLDKPIGLPIQCDAERLIKRLMSLEGSEPLIADGRLLDVFFSISLENKNAVMGNIIRKCVPDATIKAYFRKQFRENKEYLNSDVKDYLALGFGLEWLGECLVADPDGVHLTPAEFLDLIFGMQLHVSDKEAYDFTVGDMDNPVPDDVSMQFARIFGRMGGAYNRNVDAFIPVDSIREACRTAFGDMCSVDDEIQAALDRDKEKREKKEDPEDQVQDMFYGGENSEAGRIMAQQQKKAGQEAKYDIRRMADIVYYKTGDTFTPELEKTINDTVAQIHAFDIADDDFFKEDVSERERCLIHMSRHIIIPDRTWDKIFSNIMDNEYIKRYYAFLSVDVSYQSTLDFISRFMMNSDLLDHFWDVAEGIDS